MGRQLKVMVVDDAITYRKVLSDIVESLPNAVLVGTASSGKTAIMKIPSWKPDLVILDLVMPELDGIETLKKIKEINADIEVIMVSAFSDESSKETIKCLELGALDFIVKVQSENISQSIADLKNAIKPFINVVLKKGGIKQELTVKPIALPAQKERTLEKRSIPQNFNLILIGISTGGPVTLNRLFEKINFKPTCPILIVQHMPEIFTRHLAERLNTISDLDVAEAQHNDIPLAGQVLIAPGGKQMILKEDGKNSLQVKITDSQPVNHCKPSVDVLFWSAAVIKGICPLSIIMTGMGKDGTDGVRAIKENGGYCLIQDEETSTIWGMPGSVYQEGLADEILPLGKIADRINKLTS